MFLAKTISMSFAITLALGAFGAPAYADAGISKRLYLASNGRADTAGGDGALRWGPWERETSDKFTFDPKQSPDAAGKLTYKTAPLDRPVQITGLMSVEVYATSDVPGAGFTATIEDVQPDGTVERVGSSPADAAPSSPKAGKVEFIQIDLGAVTHAFAAGHSIRLEISSRAAPTFDPNAVAHQRVLHGIAHPSALVVHVTE